MAVEGGPAVIRPFAVVVSACILTLCTAVCAGAQAARGAARSPASPRTTRVPASRTDTWIRLVRLFRSPRTGTVRVAAGTRGDDGSQSALNADSGAIALVPTWQRVGYTPQFSGTAPRLPVCVLADSARVRIELRMPRGDTVVVDSVMTRGLHAVLIDARALSPGSHHVVWRLARPAGEAEVWWVAERSPRDAVSQSPTNEADGSAANVARSMRRGLWYDALAMLVDASDSLTVLDRTRLVAIMCKTRSVAGGRRAPPR
jgi:hypothetical protein